MPSQINSEHPSAPSSPYRASDFTHHVLAAITSNPEVWSKTVFFLTFDENDGLFDHLPAPAVPSYNIDGSLAGKSTLKLDGMYFNNDKGTSVFPYNLGKPNNTRIYQDKRDTISGNIRPWGLGPRVPMYIISPWSKGGWIHSEIADHTSVAQFIEKRFGVIVPAISPWHRAISSDLTSAFDFENPNDPKFPSLPDTSNFEILDEKSKKLPKATAPEKPSKLFQEKGSRFSRALAYRLHCSIKYLRNEKQVQLIFENKGSKGAVYHVYNMHRLDMIPRRYTVEAGKSLQDEWNVSENKGSYELEVYGPNGYFQKFSGNINKNEPTVAPEYDSGKGGIYISINNNTGVKLKAEILSNAYSYAKKEIISIEPGKNIKLYRNLEPSGNWYDFSVKMKSGFLHRFAGRVETGKHSVSDPAMAMEI